MKDVLRVDFNSKEGQRLKDIACELLDVSKKHNLKSHEFMAILWLLTDSMERLGYAEVLETRWVNNEP